MSSKVLLIQNLSKSTKSTPYLSNTYLVKTNIQNSERTSKPKPHPNVLKPNKSGGFKINQKLSPLKNRNNLNVNIKIDIEETIRRVVGEKALDFFLDFLPFI